MGLERSGAVRSTYGISARHRSPQPVGTRRAEWAKDSARDKARSRRRDEKQGVKRERYRSGQPGQTVNLLAYAYGGSNPPLSTIHSTACSGDNNSIRPGVGRRHSGTAATAAKRVEKASRTERNRSSAGIAQLARARAFQARGRGFEPRFPLQIAIKED